MPPENVETPLTTMAPLVVEKMLSLLVTPPENVLMLKTSIPSLKDLMLPLLVTPPEKSRGW
jgi:hypothetical protein